MTRILLALDETPTAAAAAQAAHRLFGADAEYLAINVFEEVPAAAVVRDPMTWGMVWQYDMYSSTAEDAEAARSAAQTEAADQAAAAGVAPTESIGDLGDPAEAILAAAHEHDIDVIVVGSHQRNWLSRLFDPSVASEVVKRADVPVLVVK